LDKTFNISDNLLSANKNNSLPLSKKDSEKFALGFQQIFSVDKKALNPHVTVPQTASYVRK
jgi:hypothetical protein